MRRLILIGTTVALACVLSALALGCARGQTATSASGNAQASPSRAKWVKSVDVGGSLSGPNRGRSSIGFEVKRGGVRFVVTVGAAPGWGAKVAEFHYRLWPVTNSPVFPTAPSAVTLHATVTSHGYFKTYDLRSIAPLTPGAYELLYHGAGWYQMTVYVSAEG